MHSAKVPQSHPGASGAGSAAGFGAYVHFPWCLEKCPYCDFLSVATEHGRIPHAAYADVVSAELRRRWPDLSEKGQRMRSIFFGGGTPSLWHPASLGRVLGELLGAAGERASDVEITVECNPSSFDERHAEALLEHGVNRVSIGVQGLEADRLAFLGRLHDPEGALAALRAALTAGVPRVSADLIFGVAEQAPEHAAREARVVAETGVTHISAYALTIEPGTTFGARARKNRLPLLDEALVAESFAAVHETLGELGFEHYETSNYARGGHRSAHNLGYWRGEDYVGLGCGAWGTVHVSGNHLRYRNTPVPERYTTSAAAWADTDPWREGPLVQQVESLAPETALAERIMLGLRLSEGFDAEGAARELGVPLYDGERARAVERLEARGDLIRDGGWWRLPQRAQLFADGLIAQLM